MSFPLPSEFLLRIVLRSGREECRIFDSLLGPLGHFGVAYSIDSHLVEISISASAKQSIPPCVVFQARVPVERINTWHII